ncbi:MAG TPA: ATP-binding protein [Bacilli bacterium]
MNAIQLQIPAQAEYIDIVRLCVYGLGNTLGFTYEDIEDMKVAASEACNNAVLNDPQLEGPGNIDICFESDDSSLTIKVVYNGNTYKDADPLRNGKPLHVNHVKDLNYGMLGLYLMQALMDEVTLNTNADHGTEVIMKKYSMKEGMV